MSRSITVQPKEGFLPWRAHPGPETTMDELEAALSSLKLDILRTTDDEILLVQTGEAIREGVPPPDIEELSMVMFADDAGDAILVEETGQHRAIDYDQEAKDRHFEEDVDLGLGSLPFSLEPLDITIDLEEDADREMIGDDVDLGIKNIGNK